MDVQHWPGTEGAGGRAGDAPVQLCYDQQTQPREQGTRHDPTDSELPSRRTSQAAEHDDNLSGKENVHWARERRAASDQATLLTETLNQQAMTSAAQRDCVPRNDGPAATAVAHAETRRGAEPEQQGLRQPSRTDSKVWDSLVDEDFAVLVKGRATGGLEGELAGRASDSDGGDSVRAASSCWAASPVFRWDAETTNMASYAGYNIFLALASKPCQINGCSYQPYPFLFPLQETDTA